MKRPILGMLLLAILATVVAGAVTVPFIYESQTLWYKVGSDKTMLRAGQILGLLAYVALAVQILLGTRGKTLEHVFGVPALVGWHKANGIFLCVFAALHIFLVLAPEGLGNLPLGLKHWPEMVGGGLFLLLFLQVVSSVLRPRLHFPYKPWRAWHRLVGYLALGLAGVHVLFVADSFAQGVPRMAFFGTLLAVVVAVAVGKLSRESHHVQ